MDDTDAKRIFEGEALLRRMYKYGLLDESQNKLDYVLALTPQVNPLPTPSTPYSALFVVCHTICRLVCKHASGSVGGRFQTMLTISSSPYSSILWLVRTVQL